MRVCDRCNREVTPYEQFTHQCASARNFAKAWALRPTTSLEDADYQFAEDYAAWLRTLPNEAEPFCPAGKKDCPCPHVYDMERKAALFDTYKNYVADLRTRLLKIIEIADEEYGGATGWGGAKTIADIARGATPSPEAEGDE